MEELPRQLKFFKLIIASIINHDPSIIKEDNPNPKVLKILLSSLNDSFFMVTDFNFFK